MINSGRDGTIKIGETVFPIKEWHIDYKPDSAECVVDQCLYVDNSASNPVPNLVPKFNEWIHVKMEGVFIPDEGLKALMAVLQHTQGCARQGCSNRPCVGVKLICGEKESVHWLCLEHYLECRQVLEVLDKAQLGKLEECEQ